ncbi:MAG: hypothetical protein ACP5F8_02500 [Candidatus Aenigmatarchaeota archaeon]
MVKTLEYGKKKWAAKTAGKGEKWHKRVTSPEAKERYDKNFAAYAGTTRNVLTPVWFERVSGVTPEDFNKAIEGKADKYAENLRRAVAGE